MHWPCGRHGHARRGKCARTSAESGGYAAGSTPTATVDEGMCSGAREEATCTHRDRQQWVDGVWRWCHTRSRTVSRRPGPSLTCAGAPRKRRGWRGWAAAALGLAVVAAAEPRHPPRARAKRRH